MATKKTRKPRATVAADETPEQRFIRLTNKRMVKTLGALKLVGNLARYPHTEDHTEKILNALTAAIADVERQFSAPAAKSKPTFAV